MRSHAKASSAGSTERQAEGLDSVGRGILADRGGSDDAGGSGASPQRIRRRRATALALLTAALALLVLAPIALASKEVTRYFGTQLGSGSLGGEFSQPGDIAVNTSGVGAPQGTFYVVDAGNQRIDRFDKNDRFVSAWGKDTIASSVDERQRLVVNATGGTYTLTFDGVTGAPIPYDAGSTQVRNALAALSSVGGAANVTVQNSPSDCSYPRYPCNITFQGALAGTDLPQIAVDTSELEGRAKVTTLADGDPSVAVDTGTGFEICTVAEKCKGGTASGGSSAADNGSLNSPSGVAVDQDTGNVYVSDRNNRRVDVYDGSGNFIRAFGWNVVASGPDNAAELQSLNVDATGGSFTLSFGATLPTETGAIPYDASATTVRGELEALGDVGAGNVKVSGPAGGPWTVRFVDALANANVALLGTNAALLSGDNPEVAGTGPAATATEVVAGGQSSNYEICEGAVDVCQAGSGGAGAGRFGTGTDAGSYGIAVSPPDGSASTGTVYVADAANRRVLTYSLDGTSFSSLGSSANFGFDSGVNLRQPQKVAVDSRGIVYASDSNNNGEIDRFDTRNLYGGGINSLLASIPSSVNEVQELHFSAENWDYEGNDTYRLTCPNGVQTEDIVFNREHGAGSVEYALSAACGAHNFYYYHFGNRREVTFLGAFGSKDVPQMDCTVVSTVNPTAECSVTTATQGAASTLRAGGVGGGTKGLAVDPTSDALYVLRATGSGGDAAVQQLGPVNDPGLAAAPTVADDLHGTGAGFNGATPSGLGLDPSSGLILLSDTSNTFNFITPPPFDGEIGAGNRVYVLSDPLPEPAVTLKQVTTKADTTATLTASVDPKGGLVKCDFQYSTDPGFVNPTEVHVPACDLIDPDGGYQTITQKAAGLHANTHYYYRLKTTRTLDSSAVSTTAFSSFDTDSVPPVVSDPEAIQVQDTSARLVATIDPKNSATGYVFQYGTTPALGSQTAPVNIGGGNEEITVTQVVGGLGKDTGYFFRVVASNEFGTTAGDTRPFHTRTIPFPPADPGNCPNHSIREAQGSTYLPDCRAYEMVTPPDKNQGVGVATLLQQAFATFSEDGQGAAFCVRSLFGEPAAQMTNACAPYVSLRRPGGWVTPNPWPRACHRDFETGEVGRRLIYLPGATYTRATIDLPESASCGPQGLDPAAGLPSQNLYREDYSTDPFSFDLLTPVPSGSLSSSKSDLAGVPAGASADASHVVYSSTLNQTADTSSGVEKLYDWAEQGAGSCTGSGGCLGLLSVRPDGTPFATDSAMPSQTIVGAADDPISSAVSSDGERIYFQNPARNYGTSGSIGTGRCLSGGCDLYLRHAGATTRVSESECTSECGVDTVTHRFLWADPSGKVALFDSCAKLTDDSNAASTACSYEENYSEAAANDKLYRWSEEAPPGHRLVDLSVDDEPNDGSQPKVVGVIGASSDAGADPGDNAAPGNTVYFIAASQLVAGEPTDEGLKLYRWRWNNGSPSLDYLAPYVSAGPDGDTSFSLGGLVIDPNANNRHVRVTPDGRYLAIQTALRLDPAADRDSDTDLYRWDEAGGWTCISCQLPGAPSAGDVDTSEPHLGGDVLNATLHSFPLESTISEDGRRIFFETPDALVSQDTNGESGCPRLPNLRGIAALTVYQCEDVYEWHDGTVSLITSGTGTGPSILMGATASGDEVFFITRDRLSGWDADNALDIYVAYANGGFPEPPPAPVACDLEAGGCEGPGSVAAAAAGAGTAVFQGPGNPKPAHAKKPRKHRKRHHKAHRRHSKRHGKRHAGRHPRNRHGKRRRAGRRAANYDRRTAR